MDHHKVYDAQTITALRRILDEIFSNTQVIRHKPPVSALEIAQHLFHAAASGERDFERLKASALFRLRAQ